MISANDPFFGAFAGAVDALLEAGADAALKDADVEDDCSADGFAVEPCFMDTFRVEGRVAVAIGLPCEAWLPSFFTILSCEIRKSPSAFRFCDDGLGT